MWPRDGVRRHKEGTGGSNSECRDLLVHHHACTRLRLVSWPDHEFWPIQPTTSTVYDRYFGPESLRASPKDAAAPSFRWTMVAPAFLSLMSIGSTYGWSQVSGYVARLTLNAMVDIVAAKTYRIVCIT